MVLIAFQLLTGSAARNGTTPRLQKSNPINERFNAEIHLLLTNSPCFYPSLQHRPHSLISLYSNHHDFPPPNRLCPRSVPLPLLPTPLTNINRTLLHPPPLRPNPLFSRLHPHSIPLRHRPHDNLASKQRNRRRHRPYRRMGCWPWKSAGGGEGGGV